MQSAAQMPMDLPPVGALARAQACVGTCTHYSIPLLHCRITSGDGEPLHSSTTTAEDLSGVLIAYKVSSWLLAQEKGGTEARNGLNAPSQTGPRLHCGR